LSLDAPKPLFPIAGRPIIWHHLEALSKVKSVKEVLLIGFYEEHVFRNFIREAETAFEGFSVKYLREYQSLGTAGGLYLFRDAILKTQPNNIIVMHADICCSFPLQEMLAMHEEKQAVATILGTRVAADVATNFGCIVQDAATSEVLHYVEKPESQISNMISCGVYIFDESVFSAIKDVMQTAEAEKSANLDPLHESDDRLRLEQDILTPLSQTKKMFVFETKDFWRQIKTAGSAVPANALYLQKAEQANPGGQKPSQECELLLPVYIHPTATVDPTAKLGPHVSIGANVKIGAGVRIKDAIVLENVDVKAHACVLHSIIGTDSRVGAWARVEGTPTASGQHNTTVMKNGVKVQSISVVANNVVVGDEIRLQNCIVLPQKELKGRNYTSEVIM
jgi:mannose-1-phosphate guanylyltransferase